MATYRKRNNKWYCEVHANGKRQGKSFYTKAEAKQWALEKELSSSHANVPITAKRLSDAIVRYRDEVSISKKGIKWETVRANKLLRDSQSITGILLSELNHKHFAKWRDDRLKEVAPSSVNRELNYLSSVCQWCVREWEWLNTNPVRIIKRPTNPRARDRRVSDKEIELVCYWLGFAGVVETKSQEVAVMFKLAIETAMRRSELANLIWSNVNLVDRYVTLVDTKNGDKRDVPLSSNAVELFSLLPNKGNCFGVSAETATTLFRRAVKNAGIENLRLHDARHEAITRLSRKLDVLDLARMIGHRDPKSLMTYYNPTASEIAKRLD